MDESSKEELRKKRAEYMREYTRKNREKICAKRRERYHKNPEAVLSRQREYNAKPEVKARMKEYCVAYNANDEAKIRRKELNSRPEAKAKKQEIDRAYYARIREKDIKRKMDDYYADPQRVIDRNRAWRKGNPEKVLAKNQRRRASKAKVVVENVAPSAIYERDAGICQLCKKPVEREKMTLDHVVPLSKGGAHTFGNLQLAHRSCNSSKGAKLL